MMESQNLFLMLLSNFNKIWRFRKVEPALIFVLTNNQTWRSNKLDIRMADGVEYKNPCFELYFLDNVKIWGQIWKNLIETFRLNSWMSKDEFNTFWKYIHVT